ncbi:hypothetical protein ABIC63_005999, partial [Pseudacidovorax sp. 1753]|uniref:hypothetical protein n=1 Tax=Pseudacidovorax sp. 1753 TaxID=3156419 RepID=UPI003394D210
SGMGNPITAAIAKPLADAIVDYDLGPRVQGLAGTVMASFGVAAGAASGNVLLTGLSLDQMYAQASMAVFGTPAATVLNRGLQEGLGLSPAGAAMGEMALTMGAAAGPAVVSALRSRVAITLDGVAAGSANSGPVLGGRGPATAWRGFDETLAGGPVRDFTTDGVRISQRGIDVVERHVARFGADDANNVMISRLRQIAAGQISPAEQDLNFYTHELREFVRYRKMGWETGVPHNPDQARQLWLQTHSASLADYNLPLKSENLLYHPDALKVMGW